MGKFLYPIYKLPLISYEKWWLYNSAKKRNGVLSDIIFGSDLTLENSLPKRFKIFDILGNTSQNTSTYKGLLKVPSTLSQTINGITFTVNNDGSVTVKGTATDNTSIDLNLEHPLILNGTYTFSLKTVGSANNNAQQWILRDANNVSVGLNPAIYTNQTTSITAENLNVTASILRIYTVSNKEFDCTIYPLLEEGSIVTDWDSATTNTSPNPDYPQEVKRVTGNINIKIENEDKSLSQNILLPLGDIELCKIDNEQDYFIKENRKWYMHNSIRKFKLAIADMNNTNSYPRLEKSNTNC